ncbi:zf-TFIIB domain-containing protein [Polaromonas sp. YR568]|uniref:TFIIB-type zinc ribbon-containing protein n=1 Tax=Polaromonas sp. YR568 TaxID=1855301 RepID=UPI00313798BD
MKCPTCPDTTLTMSERQGVEIDYCPSCRGIWLDRGELDKLLERATSAAAAPAPQAPAAVQAPAGSMAPRGRHPDFEDSDYRSGQRYYQSRKRSWLHDIFD